MPALDGDSEPMIATVAGAIANPTPAPMMKPVRRMKSSLVSTW
jgi:hypothetical protein